MYVKLLEGKNAGEVVDMPYHFAAPLIAQGRVIDARELDKQQHKETENASHANPVRRRK